MLLEGVVHVDFWKSVGPMLSGKGKGLDINISLVERGNIVTNPQIASNVFNDYYVNITTMFAAEQ